MMIRKLAFPENSEKQESTCVKDRADMVKKKKLG